MSQWSTEFRVGIFAVIAFMVIAYMFMVLGGTFESVAYKTYYTQLSNASGIIPKSQVKTNGVLVGEVGEVTLADNKTQIKLLIDEKVKIPVGSTLEVRSKGLLGDVFIEIVRIKDEGTYIEEGGTIPYSTESVDMATLMKTFGAIGTDIKKITSALASDVEAGDGSGGLKGIIKNIENTTKNLDELVAKNTSTLDKLIKNLHNSSEIVNGALENNKGGLNNMFANMDKAVSNLNEASSSVKNVADKIERGEGTIGRLLTDDTVIKDIEGTLADVRKVISPVSKTVVEVDFHGEMDQNNGEDFRNYANIKIHTRPDKYYLIGIADIGAQQTLERQRVTTTETNGSTTTEDLMQTETEEAKIKFNLQFAKRWSFLSVRFGMFQSEGGVATDLYFFRDRLRFSLEVFNFGSEDLQRDFAHLKTYASLRFFSHLYAMAGVDDVTATDSNGDRADPNYFFGAGLSFNDEDIKTLLGFAASASATR